MKKDKAITTEVTVVEVKLPPADSVDLNGNVVDYTIPGMPIILDLKHEDAESLKRAMRIHERISIGSVALPLVLDKTRTPEEILNSLPLSVDVESFTMGSLVQHPVCAECECVKKKDEK